MLPVVTPEEMRAIDAAAVEPVEVLIERAGRAVARHAVAMLGGTYGRRVVVVAGPGNNGADGRVAAEALVRRGVRVAVVEPHTDHTITGVDLVIDAAFGTGLSREYAFPPVEDGIPVLAVDIPSGVHGLTGERLGRPQPADETITFVALKPGLLHEPGRSLAGRVRIAAIDGLGVGDAATQVVSESDVARWVAPRHPTDHKWKAALRVVGGSAGMTGAVQLAALGASRVAGYVEVAVPGAAGVDRPVEAVGRWLPGTEWGRVAAADLERFGAVLVGPGLRDVGELGPLLECETPLVLDASALVSDLVGDIRGRSAPTIVTPHDGEFVRIGGGVGPDRIATTREVASDLGAIVVRKGPTTTIAAPDGPVRIVANGGPELATAGTGDVLAGLIGALLASGCSAFDAAAAGVWIHAESAAGQVGLVASDLPARIADVLARLQS